LERRLAAGIELMVFDVQDQEDLHRVCATVGASGLRVVWVGSTGLAEFVPAALGLNQAGRSQSAATRLDPRPALVIAGSASETTRQQLSHAQVAAGLRLIQLNPAAVVAGGAAADGEIERVLLAVRTTLRAGYDAGLTVLSSREDIGAVQGYGAKLGLTPSQVARQIAEALAAAGGTVAIEGDLSGVVATGGDTAKAFCAAFRAEALEIVGEVEAGIPLMRLLGPRTLPLVTKAGGFGSLAAIVHSIELVKHLG
jgi:uncharacterized protein YgbK (DUF1537 family)